MQFFLVNNCFKNDKPFQNGSLISKTVNISVLVGAHNKNVPSERWGELYLEGYGNCDLGAAHHVPMKGLKDKQVQPLSKVCGDNLCWSPF